MPESKKILVVDNEESFVRLVKINLESTGHYMVRTQIKGREALAACREFKPHLVLLDLNMPDLDGAKVAHQIKEDPLVKNTPIVFVTALIQRKEASSEGEAFIGGHPFLSKPVRLQELVEAIKKYAR
ncbi:MAG: response regulator [Candidatus Omnitrophica bacterium]|nr:response regulator [Candidatus Omnitrophota bacterium]